MAKPSRYIGTESEGISAPKEHTLQIQHTPKSGVFRRFSVIVPGDLVPMLLPLASQCLLGNAGQVAGGNQRQCPLYFYQHSGANAAD